MSKAMSNGEKMSAYGVSMSQRKRVIGKMMSVICVSQGNCNAVMVHCNTVREESRVHPIVPQLYA
jgi:hypothetical protein